MLLLSTRTRLSQFEMLKERLCMTGKVPYGHNYLWEFAAPMSVRDHNLATVVFAFRASCRTSLSFVVALCVQLRCVCCVSCRVLCVAVLAELSGELC